MTQQSEKLWGCKFCGKNFRYAHTLWSHRRKHPEYWDWLISGTADQQRKYWLQAEKNFAATFKPRARRKGSAR